MSGMRRLILLRSYVDRVVIRQVLTVECPPLIERLGGLSSETKPSSWHGIPLAWPSIASLTPGWLK